MSSGNIPPTNNIETSPATESEDPWQKMANEVRAERQSVSTPETNEISGEGETDIDVLSYYESNDIPTNPNGDLILDPNASQFPRDEGRPKWIESYVFTTSKDAEFLRTAEMVELSNGNKVNSELLKRCLTVDAYYSCAKRHMLEDNPYSGVVNALQLFYGDVENIRQGMADIGGGDSIRSKSDLVKGFAALEQSGQLGELSDTEKKRLEEFREIASPRAFVEKVRGTQYETTIDGKQCVLPVDNILTFLSLPPDRLKEICTTDPDGKIGQLSKMEFAYAATKYLKDNKVIENYALPDDLESRTKRLMSGQFIDFSAANRLTETQDTLYEKANLNSELRDAILEQMPDDVSSLEKAAYIYAKMCTILTYDNKFMAANQKGEAAEKHRSLDYVEQISPENNEVVCFEFNMIYAKMLNELGLNFKSEYKNMTRENYGNGHANLEFRDGKFIVRADSVSSILGGDIARAKLGLPLIGFECESKNKRTQQEFQESVSRMYELVQQQEREKSPWDEYDLLTENLKPVEFDEKKSILLEKLKTTSLCGIDAMTYALQLRKALFSEQERKDNVSVVVLRNNEVAGQGPKLEAGAVIAMNGANLDERPNETSYYYLSSDRELTSLTLEDIKTKLDNGTFEYIERKDPKIPGTISSVEKQEEQ
ncbi:MAG: hypothetical protein Q4A36_00115 [Candidatus Saccharibacteria bacterium]|nr:hypothetical protein [Candidatus Saccharibacteria bacterium]